jgi:hypothetical protein
LKKFLLEPERLERAYAENQDSNLQHVEEQLAQVDQRIARQQQGWTAILNMSLRAPQGRSNLLSCHEEIASSLALLAMTPQIENC